MLGKTHVCAGMAASLVVLQPASVAAWVCAVAGGALGGWISDVDVRGPRFARGAVVSVCVVGVAFGSRLVAALSGVSALEAAAAPMGPAALVGAALFAAVTVAGSLTSHRGFTHSLVGCALWCLAMALLWPQVAPSFGVGLCSHLLLDLLNRAPKGAMRLFFPFKARVCLDLCRADGLANSLIWVVSCTVFVVMGGQLLFQAV